MALKFNGVYLENNQKISDYNIKNGDTLVQCKTDLKNISGVTISHEADMIDQDSSDVTAKKSSFLSNHSFELDLTQLLLFFWCFYS